MTHPLASGRLLGETAKAVAGPEGATDPERRVVAMSPSAPISARPCRPSAPSEDGATHPPPRGDCGDKETPSTGRHGPDADCALPGRDLSVKRPWAEAGRARPYYEDRELHSLHSRAIAYLRAGVAVRFQGPAGTGKTAIALRVAHDLARPVAYLTGHSRMTREDLVGRTIGVRTSRLEDRYIASVRRSETRSQADWQDGPLAAAMRLGRTLVYDEFTRTPPDANSALLSVLEEGVLGVPHAERGQEILVASPEFRIVLTSNPADYKGTSDAPDALLDRLVTFEMVGVSAETEIGIVAAATGIGPAEARRIVELLRAVRRAEPDDPARIGWPERSVSMRTAILVARLLVAQGVAADYRDSRFVQICADVLRGRISRGDTEAAVIACIGQAASTAYTERDRKT